MARADIDEEKMLENKCKRNALLQALPEQASSVYQEIHAGSMQGLKLRGVSRVRQKKISAGRAGTAMCGHPSRYKNGRMSNLKTTEFLEMRTLFLNKTKIY